MTQEVQWVDIDPMDLLGAVSSDTLKGATAWLMFRAVTVLLKMTSEIEDMISSLNILLQTVIRAAMADSIQTTVTRIFNEAINATFEEIPQLYALKLRPAPLVKFMDSEIRQYTDIRRFNARLNSLKEAFRAFHSPLIKVMEFCTP